ncbi:MAG: hypothetical protein Q8P56_05370 [Candidatus Uhrbacteria bacterium]|nr:hypothetical protein [Candidatus Uhrbacteria bacterium]
MTDSLNTTGYDSSQSSVDECLTRVNDELEKLYTTQAKAQDAGEREEATRIAARLQDVQRALSHVKGLRPGMTLLDALDDIIRVHQSRPHSDQKNIEVFQAAKEYVLGRPPVTVKDPRAKKPRSVDKAEAVEQTIERLKQRVHLEGLLFVLSSLPTSQWEEGKKNSAVFGELATLYGGDAVYCPGQSSLLDKKFLDKHMTMLFNSEVWGAPKAREFSDYSSQKERDAFTYRIAPLKENVYERREEKETVSKKPLFGFIPLGTEERSVTRNVYKGTRDRDMSEFVETRSKKRAFHVSFLRTAWTKWEGGELGRPGDECITLIVPEDIACEIAALIQESDRSAISLYDALRPSWMGGEDVIRFRETSFIRGEIKIPPENE